MHEFFFSYFSTNFLSLLSSLIRFFKHWIENFLILKFKNSHLNCLSVMLAWSRIHRVPKHDFAFEVKEFLNFQRPFPQSIISFNSSEKKTQSGSDPYKRKLEQQIFFDKFLKSVRNKKKSSLRSIKREEWIWRNVKRLVLGFFIFHISHKQRVFLFCLFQLVLLVIFFSY